MPVEEKVPLDRAEMPEYKAARNAGRVRTAATPEEEAEDEDRKPPEIDGKEEMREFKEKRQEQIHGPGVQKRIDRLVKERSILRDKVTQYEAKEKAAEDARPKTRDDLLRAKAEKYIQRMPELAKRHKDFAEVHANAAKIQITETMQGQLMSLDNGPEVTLYLGRHPEISRDLHKLDAGEAMRKIERISWKLEDQAEREKEQEEQEKREVKRAPEPIRALGGGSSTSTVPLDQMDMPAFKLARAKGRVR